MKRLLLSVAVMLASTSLYAQTQADTKPAIDTTQAAKIYVFRNTGFVGSAINLRITVDSVMYCKIRNNRYAIIWVPAGEHSFFANSWDSQQTPDKLALRMQVEAGRTYFMSMRIKQGFLKNQIFLEEITQNTARPLLEKLKQDEECE